MAVTAYWYGLAFQSLFNPVGTTGSTRGEAISLANDTIRVMLLNPGYSTTTAQDTHQFATAANISTATTQVTGTGYSAGGATLTSKVSTYTANTNVWNFDAADVTWTTATITANYAVIYDATHASGPLLAYVDFGGAQSSAGGDFQIVWAASGILSVTVST